LGCSSRKSAKVKRVTARAMSWSPCTVAFDLVGNLTVKGVTRPAIWQVTATVQGDQLMARAVTRFTFADFRLLQPKVSILLGVADTIALEYDVAMRRTR
jgi:hypothetical protein